jgi:23S rRNA pseudouridine1911/1915/1917 synthase
MTLELLLDQPPVLVVNKPGGILTQAPPGIDSLEKQVREFERERAGVQGNIYLGVPHRLDRPVSGAIVFARNVRAARRLAEQFEYRTVEKTYWVLVEGHVTPDAGTWQDSMRKVPGEARAECVEAAHADAQQAVLHYEVQRRGEFGSWLAVRLETGRMHQIRLQAATRGHAVLGDEQYGAGTRFGPQTEDRRARWIALHARRLAFLHPKTREPVEAVAPLPPAWRDFVPEHFRSA